MEEFVSLVVLSYKRPDYIKRSMESLLASVESSTVPCEIIAVDDGSGDSCVPYLQSLYMKGRISTLILNRGKNMGVGHGMNRGFSVARGKWVCKLDVDLTYTPGWIEAGIELLSIPNVAVAGFFDYKNYVPDDSRFEKIYPIKRDDTLIGYSVTDFVGSSFMIRRKDWLEFGVINGSWRGFEEYSAAFAEDVEWKLKMQEKGYKLAITPVDYHQNFGFGLGKSTVVVLNDDAQPEVAKISDTPLLFGGVKHV